MKDYTQPPDAGADGIIEGRNAVAEALRSGTPIDKLYIARAEGGDGRGCELSI